jgi:hypothetical protein
MKRRWFWRQGVEPAKPTKLPEVPPPPPPPRPNTCSRHGTALWRGICYQCWNADQKRAREARVEEMAEAFFRGLKRFEAWQQEMRQP